MHKPQFNNLYDYWHWPNFFNENQIADMHNIFRTNKVNDAEDNAAGGKTKKVNLVMTHYGHLRPQLYSLEQSIFKINQDFFGYNIWPQFDDNMVILNEYDSNVKGEYDWHVDSSSCHTYDMKYTVLINASLAPYQGGKFSYFRSGEKQIDELDNPGNVIMFKSQLSHKVYPVLKGKRYSIALFYMGPRFV